MKLLKNLKKIIHFQSTIYQTISGCVRNYEELLYLKNKLDTLTQSALYSTRSGTTDIKISKEEIIVSLTTYGRRFYDSYIAIESIMQGTVRPNKIILWVSEDLKTETLPLTLQNQIKRGLEIRYRRDIRSYTKLIYALKEYREACVVTIDDDIIYPYDMLENLVNVHNEIPDVICANAIRPVPNDFEQSSLTYSQLESFEDYKEICKGCYLLEGYNGVLYPPKCFSNEVFNENVFLDMCKTADDVWFSAMAMLNNTKIVYANPHLNFFRFVVNENVQSLSLRSINHLNNNLNDIQIKNVYKKYGVFNVD